MTYRTDNFSEILPGQQGYRTFEKKQSMDSIPLPPRKSIFTSDDEFVDLSPEELKEFEQQTVTILKETYCKQIEPTPATATVSELTITIRDDERSLKSKHLLYDSYTVNSDDPVVKDIIAKALQEFNGEPTAIRIRISLVVL